MGIEKSRNLMTIRLADQLGLEKISDISKDLGIYEKFPLLISSSLGSLESTLLKITSAYASIANGGIKIEPAIIDAILDNRGKLLYSREKRKCIKCKLDFDVNLDSLKIENIDMPKIKEKPKEFFLERISLSNDFFLNGSY